MNTSENTNENQTQSKVDETKTTDLSLVSLDSADIINKLLAETDVQKADELISMFNFNQKKKTMARVNKLGAVQDTFIEQITKRISSRPDEIPTSELLQGLKIVQDVSERNQKSVNTVDETPLIQINQQTNDISIGDETVLPKASRDKVKNAVAGILASIAANTAADNHASKNIDIIDAEGDAD